ncbi:hypothetical protein [Lewinella sp. LCG006]|uniref:hypothetical protein n=1 Tax=Lewinella sp. LCG006 TaxID=3231911 RepID=UPI003460A39B
MEETIVHKLMIKEPKFAKRYEHLFERFSRKWGGSEQDRRDRVKVFAKNYELYMYAFFLGLRKHKSVKLESPEKSSSNVMAIRDWKPEALRDYLVACTLAEDGTPFRDYDFMMEAELDKKSLELREIVEAYTNGGLAILEEEFKQDKAYFDKPFSFTEFVFE